jgi:hypothetical protein
MYIKLKVHYARFAIKEIFWTADVVEIDGEFLIKWMIWFWNQTSEDSLGCYLF